MGGLFLRYLSRFLHEEYKLFYSSDVVSDVLQQRTKITHFG